MEIIYIYIYFWYYEVDGSCGRFLFYILIFNRDKLNIVFGLFLCYVDVFMFYRFDLEKKNYLNYVEKWCCKIWLKINIIMNV